MKLDPDKSFQTTLISADFGDAYTETCIQHVQESISKIGSIIGLDEDYTILMRELIQLVFTNCYFFTPLGLYRQTRGMPMGDVSSRDALDIDLTTSEFEILSSLSSISLKVHLYCRLVDDISIVVQGSFPGVRELIYLLASEYPNMPLNVGISLGYSRFLDLHVNLKSLRIMDFMRINLFIPWPTKNIPPIVILPEAPTLLKTTNIPLFPISSIVPIPAAQNLKMLTIISR